MQVVLSIWNYSIEAESGQLDREQGESGPTDPHLSSFLFPEDEVIALHFSTAQYFLRADSSCFDPINQDGRAEYIQSHWSIFCGSFLIVDSVFLVSSHDINHA